MDNETEALVYPDRMFGAVLRAFRKHGLRETAARIPVNFSHLSKWERGERPVPDYMVPALDRAYAANGALITLHELIKRERLRSVLAFKAAPLGSDDERRHLTLRLLAAIATATTTPTEPLEALAALDGLADGVRAAIANRDGIDLEKWERLVWERGLSHCTDRPGAALSQLTIDYARLSGLLGKNLAPAAVRTGLLRVAARLAVLLAMQWGDLGFPALADGCWQYARDAADSSGDRELRVRVRGWEAHCGYWADRPAASLARLIDEAAGIADDAPGVGLALAYATRALLAADRGQDGHARAALEDFHAVADRLPAEDHDLPVWDLPAWARAYHLTWPYLLLGDLPSASWTLTEAEKLCPPDFPGHIADLRLYRAHTLIINLDIDHGLESALTATRGWPLVPRRRHVLTRLLAALPREAHTHPDAQALHRLI